MDFENLCWVLRFKIFIGVEDGAGGIADVKVVPPEMAETEKAVIARRGDKLVPEFGKIQVWLVRTPQRDKEKVERRIGCFTGK